MTLTRTDLDEMKCAHGCENHPIALTPACHQGAPTRLYYDRDKGMLTLECAVYEKFICDIEPPVRESTPVVVNYDDADFNYDELDPGIRQTVRLLRQNGFPTVDSGDGVSKTESLADPEGCAYPFANVLIEVDPDSLVHETKRLLVFLAEQGIAVVPMTDADPVGCVSIQANYDPVDGHSLIMLFGLDDALLKHITGG